MVNKNFVRSAIKKPGALRKSLGVKKIKNIPTKNLGKTGQRVRLSKVLGNINK